MAQGEAAVHLDLYQVPLDSWHSELSQYMDRLAAAVANALHTDDPQTNQVNVQVCTVHSYYVKKFSMSDFVSIYSGDGLLEAFTAGYDSTS